MSLFAKKQLLLGIEQNRITAAFITINNAPKLKDAFYLENSSHESIYTSEPVNSLLKNHKPNELRVTISDRIAKHYVIENIHSAKNIKEIKTIAAIHLETIFNTDQNDWEIEIDLNPGNTTALACALPKALLSGLRTFADQNSLKTTKISSFFSSEANRFRKKITKPEFWLVVKDRTTITLAYYIRGNWQAIRNNHIQHHSIHEIQELIIRNAIFHQNNNNGRHIYLAGFSDFSESISNSIEILPNERSIWPNDFRIALSDYWP